MVDEREEFELSRRGSPGAFSLLVDVCIGGAEAAVQAEDGSDGRGAEWAESS